jgi:hypothetical protein
VEEVGTQRRELVVQAKPACRFFESLGNQICKGAAASHPRAERGVIVLTIATVLHLRDHLTGAVRHVFGHPLVGQIFDLKRHAQHDVAGRLGAGFSCGFEDRFDFMIGEPGNDGGDHDAGGNAGTAEQSDSLKPPLRR